MWSLTLPRIGRTSGAEKFRSSVRKDFFDSIDPERTSGLSSATDRAGDALGQCEIPLGPNWLFWFNRQRGVQFGHSSYTFAAVAASNPLQS